MAIDLALALLFSAITCPFRRLTVSSDYPLEAKSHCDDMRCIDLPREQWKVEVRRWFVISLAHLQYSVLDIVRGIDQPGTARSGVGKRVEVPPPNLRGTCHMGKFKSVGWRNVSVWGLVGLLSLCGAVSLASVATETTSYG